MNPTTNSEEKAGELGPGHARDPQAIEFLDSCEACLHLVLVPRLNCLKKNLCAASPELKREILAKIHVCESSTRSKEELLNQLKMVKKDLEVLGSSKFSVSGLQNRGRAPGKVSSACTASICMSKL